MDHTPWNPEWSNSIDRVAKLVEGTFACRVQFHTIESFLDRAKLMTSYLEQDLAFLQSSLFTPPQVIRSVLAGCSAFPLRVRRAGAPAADVSLVGVATVEGLAASDDERLAQIAEFLHLAVEAKLDAFERLLDIEQNENLQKQVAFDQAHGKVVQLFPLAGRTPVDFDPAPINQQRAQVQLDRPILCVTAKGFPADRLALDLFNKTDLWIFVRIEDLDEDTFQSAQSIRSLGRMCIFAADLAKVPVHRQLRLAEYLSSDLCEGDDSPRVISAICESPTQLVEKGLVVAHLLPKFSVIEIAPSTPVRQATLLIEKHLINPMVDPSQTSALVDSSMGTLIPLLGHLRRDDGSPPTFH